MNHSYLQFQARIHIQINKKNLSDLLYRDQIKQGLWSIKVKKMIKIFLIMLKKRTQKIDPIRILKTFNIIF